MRETADAPLHQLGGFFSFLLRSVEASARAPGFLACLLGVGVEAERVEQTRTLPPSSSWRPADSQVFCSDFHTEDAAAVPDWNHSFFPLKAPEGGGGGGGGGRGSVQISLGALETQRVRVKSIPLLALK